MVFVFRAFFFCTSVVGYHPFFIWTVLDRIRLMCMEIPPPIRFNYYYYYNYKSIVFDNQTTTNIMYITYVTYVRLIVTFKVRWTINTIVFFIAVFVSCLSSSNDRIIVPIVVFFCKINNIFHIAFTTGLALGHPLSPPWTVRNGVLLNRKLCS